MRCTICDRITDGWDKKTDSPLCNQCEESISEAAYPDVLEDEDGVTYEEGD